MAEPQTTASPPASAAASPAAAAGDILEAIDAPLDEDYDSEPDSALGEDNSTFTASISSSILKYRTLNGRTYHSDRGGDSYWGTNDDRQNNLLDIQHHVFTLLLGHKLYLAPLPESVGKVLDIGTGTGAWAIDFADLHPESEVIGTDLSPIQPTWVPPNVQFQIDDFTKTWTFAENEYDFVHIRWLNGCMPDWDELFRQAYRVLKPGGWVQSFDVNGYLESDDGTVTPESACGVWSEVILGGAKKLGLKSSFSTVKDGLQRHGLEAAGFVGLREFHYKVPLSEWPRDAALQEVGMYSRALLEEDTEGVIQLLATGLGWTPQEITVYAARLRKELRGLKVHPYYQAKLVYAQKPLAQPGE